MIAQPQHTDNHLIHDLVAQLADYLDAANHGTPVHEVERAI